MYIILMGGGGEIRGREPRGFSSLFSIVHFGDNDCVKRP